MRLMWSHLAEQDATCGPDAASWPTTDDLPAATAFLVELGLKLQCEGRRPNTPGIRHIAFAVDDIAAVVASLRARGAELGCELQRHQHS